MYAFEYSKLHSNRISHEIRAFSATVLILVRFKLLSKSLLQDL